MSRRFSGSKKSAEKWLRLAPKSTLTRNCEYATDIPAFEEPFEREFSYIAGLWADAKSKVEFGVKYSREVSNKHDAKYC